jgi:AraC-like DNA-binding protein
MPGPNRSTIHVIRTFLLERFVTDFRTLGAPVDQLLDSAGISLEFLAFPDALVPLAHAFRFTELSCAALGTEHAGLEVGLKTSLEDFGSYGACLSRAPTIGVYLRQGVRLFNSLNSGERLWLSRHGKDMRLNIESPGDNRLGAHQSHLCTLAVTIHVIREAAGHEWSPLEVGFAHKLREPLPHTDLLAGTRVEDGVGHSYLTVPLSLISSRFPSAMRSRTPARATRDGPLPTRLDEIVLNQIETLSMNGAAPRIDTVAGSLGLNLRTLQREICRQGTNYCNLVRESRLRRACNWLENSDKTVTEIAFDLGYNDASNFTRAFRKLTGLSPSAYRREAGFD